MESKIHQKRGKMRKILILGTGCPKCRKMAENAEAGAEALGSQPEMIRSAPSGLIEMF